MGPYICNLCKERSFKPDLHSAARADDRNISLDTQLRLHPRLQECQRRARQGLKNLDDDRLVDLDNPHVRRRSQWREGEPLDGDWIDDGDSSEWAPCGFDFQRASSGY